MYNKKPMKYNRNSKHEPPIVKFTKFFLSTLILTLVSYLHLMIDTSHFVSAVLQNETNCWACSLCPRYVFIVSKSQTTGSAFLSQKYIKRKARHASEHENLLACGHAETR